MSVVRISDLRRIFAALDRDGDARLSAEEMSPLLEAVGSSREEIGSAVGPEGFDFEAFVRFFEAKAGVDEEAELREAFGVFDRDGDGFISSAEVHDVLQLLGLWEESGGDCEKMIGRFDANSDGQLDFHEFRKMMLCSVQDDDFVGF